MRARDLYDHAFLVRARFPFFADLVVLAGSLYPIPSRTRPLNSPAPMVLSIKAWKSRSLPGLPKTEISSHDDRTEKALAETRGLLSFWQLVRSSPRVIAGLDPAIPPFIAAVIARAVRLR